MPIHGKSCFLNALLYVVNQMTHCLPCQAFIDDWLSQPISPKECILYNNINHQRLGRVIPQISKILKRFICNLDESYMNLIMSKTQEKPVDFLFKMLTLPKDIVENELKNHVWHLTTVSCKLNDPSEIESVLDILTENFVCKNMIENELLGYYLINLIFVLKELHICHIKKPVINEVALEVVILE